MIVLSLFDGISCGRIALERAGFKDVTYYASEIDDAAIKVSESNYPDIIRLGDVTGWRNWNIDWGSVDLLIGGSPCQGFSLAGKQLNFNDSRSKLFFEYKDILGKIRAENKDVKFLLENVVMKKEYVNIISSYLGVTPVLIDSSLVSAQMRKRLYWANWEIAQPDDKGIKLSDIIENGIVENEKAYCLTCRGGNARDYFKKHQTNIVFMSNASGKYLVDAGKISMVFDKSPDKSVYRFDVRIPDGRYNIRMLSEIECERLQTVPDNYTAAVGKTQRLNQLGNGWTVDVIAHILEQLKNQLTN